MNNTVRCKNISNNNFSIFDLSLAIYQADHGGFTLKGLNFFKSDHVGSKLAAFSNMEGQYIGQGGNIS